MSNVSTDLLEAPIMKKNLKLAAAIVLSIALLLSGCSKNPITPIEKDETESQPLNSPKVKNEIVIGVSSQITLDPIQAKTDEDRSIANLVYSGLVTIDGQGRIKPSLADTWDVSADGRVYTFHLKKGVKWHDGQKLSSEDVIATFDKIFQIKKEREKIKVNIFPEFDYISSYSAPDDSTVVISLNKPFAGIIHGMTVGIMPASTLKVPLSTDENKDKPVPGTGPYKITNRTSNSVILEKNDGYLEKKPIIAKIFIKMFPETSSLKESFRQEIADLIFIEAQDWNFFKGIKDVSLIQYPSRYFEFIALNQKNPIFKDVSVRSALLAGIDRTKVLQNAVNGLGIVVDGPILPYSWAFNSGVQNDAYSKEKAMQILKEAGWSDTDGDGIVEKKINGRKQKLEFELLVNASNSSRYQAAADIEKNLKEIGVSVKLVNLSWEELKNKVLARQYDASLMGWKLSPVPDPGTMFSSSEIKNGYNFVSYSNKELDEILAKAAEERDEEAKKELMYKAQEIISRDVPYIFLYSPNNLLAVNRKIKGINPNPINIFDNISEWRLE
jgi:peptide/nickel transport system substrate-binding protein